MADAFDVIVVGSINGDFLGRGEELPRPGETANGDTFYEGAGGKGANQAVAAARLGARVALVAAVGTDNRGHQLVAHLEREGVDVQFVRKLADVPTGAALIHVNAQGEKQILAVLGANRLLTPADVRQASAALGSARAILTQLEVPIDCCRAALEWGRATGARTILDPAPAAPLEDDVIRLVDVIKPNAREAEVLTGIRVKDRKSARRAARRLLDRGAGAVTVQAGDEGDLLVWPDGEHWLPRIAVEAMDATGAGDAFAGTLATYLARGSPLVEAARFANAGAALATTALGAQAGLAREEALRELLQRSNSRG